MSAEPEEVEEFVRQGSLLAVKVASNATGAIIGAVIAGPPGAILGSLVAPVLEHQFGRAVGEFVTRQLGERQRERAAAGTVLLAADLKRRLGAGQKLRDDDFEEIDQAGSRPIDEVTEQAIIDMMNSVETRRIPFLANFYASLYFDKDITRSSIATFVKILGDLNYRSMCILGLVGRGLVRTGKERPDGEPSPWTNADHTIAREVFNLINASLLVNKADDASHYAATLGYTDIEPGTLQLSPIGLIVYEKMKLSELPSNLPEMVETQQSLQRIALSPSGQPNLLEQYERALAPFEKKFELSDWVASANGYVMNIPISDHKNAGTPLAQVEAKTQDGAYEQVYTDVSTDADGTVRIRTSKPFIGRVVIP